ncbi:MAG: phytanoyl-CoA dioxygenase family protein [Bacteroidia bacterium]
MAKRLPIFKDANLQKTFETKGFVVIPDFISAEQINHLDSFFDKHHPNLPLGGFNSDSYLSDFELKELSSNEILKTFTSSYERVFQNYQAFGGSFLYKMPADDSELVMHQDWTIVDEEQYVAINCWVPLCDTSIENGTLMVLPGAHYDALPVHRAPTLDFFFKDNENIIRSKLIPLEVKAGTAVILNQSLVHFSPPNKSDKIRKAITAGIKSEGAPMLFYYKNPDKQNELELFTMDENFLIRFDNFFQDIFKRPEHGMFIKNVAYTLPQFSAQELEILVNKMLNNAGYKKAITEKSFTKRLMKKVFG